MATQTEQKTWFITGVSGGLGKSIALEAANSGYVVFGTLRKREQVDEFDQLVPGKTFGVLLDVNKHDDIQTAIDTIIDKTNRIDVLVNNAGYGLFGAIEEVSMEEARQQMETNFFGALAVTQKVLPVMRQQKSGNIVQISSMAGMNANPGVGLYNASKFALEGYSEALSKELAPLNIFVTIVEPGPFRTEWAGSSSKRAEKIIDDYKETAHVVIDRINGYSGQQPGDPEKAAKAIIKAVTSEKPPLRLPLGEAAVNGILDKLKSVEQNINEWKEVSLNTSY